MASDAKIVSTPRPQYAEPGEPNPFPITDTECIRQALKELFPQTFKFNELRPIDQSVVVLRAQELKAEARRRGQR